MSRPVVVAFLIATVLAGCQQKTEQKPAQTTPTPPPQTQAPTTDKRTPRPAMKQSDARVWIDPATISGTKGSSGSFKVDYYGVEPSRAIVVPLSYPVGMKVDSISFAGGIVDYLSTHPTRIENEAHFLLLTAIPMTEPDIPAKEGMLARVFYSFGQDAVAGAIEDTFVPPGNYLSYVDTTGALLEPSYEPAKVVIQ